MFQRVLIVLDTPDTARLASTYGLQLARSSGASVHFVAVVELPALSESIDELKDLEEESRARLDPIVAVARAQAEALGQPVTSEFVVGLPASAVLGAAARIHADLVVIGGTEEHVSRKWRSLISTAPCPVFVARALVVSKYEGPPGHRKEHWEVRSDRRTLARGRGRVLQIFVGESDLHEGRPVYELVVEQLRALDIAGATVFRGLLGFGAAGRLRRRRVLWSHDAPMLVVAVDRPDAIEKAISAVGPLVRNGLVMTSDAEVIKYAPGVPVKPGTPG
jgi:PII-like signaling protein/nucleotide-binding universal stress UspA family protein